MSVSQQSLDSEQREPRPATSGEALGEDRRRKLELGEVVRDAMNLASERRHHGLRDEAGKLLARLVEDRFQLAVVGQFSRGKSTLMNAILGHPQLPTGALPMTSVLTTVTPGIGSAVAANTATTKRFLPEADAVMFVTGFDAPLSEPELQFPVKVRRHVEKLFLVVNKLDLVSPDEADEVVEFVRQRLGRQPDGEAARLFAVSARDGLQARMHHNREELTESRLPELEHSRVQFLTDEKASALLLRICLVERSDSWTEELRSRALSEIEERWPSSDGGSSRDWVHEAASHLHDAAPRLFEPWLVSRLAEARSLLVALAPAELDELYAMRGSVEGLAAQIFAVPFDAISDHAWSPAELPHLAVGQVAFDVGVDLPRPWRMLSGARLESEGRARLLQGVDAALAAYGDAVRAVLGLAACRRVRDVAAVIKRETLSAANRFLEHARDPASEEQLAELGNLERRLATLRASPSL